MYTRIPLSLLLTVLLLLTGTLGWAADDKAWTIDDHITAIDGMVDYAKEVRDVTVNNPKYTDFESQLAETEFRKIIADLEAWLALAKQAKQGDRDAVEQLYNIDQDRHRLLFTSAAYLGLDQAAYRAYLRQAMARTAMLQRLLKAHQTP